MKKLLPRQYAVILYELTNGKKGTDIEKVVETFACFLRERQSLKLLHYIANEFERYSKERAGVHVGTMTTARDLGSKETKEIEKLLGEKVELEMETDAALIGGTTLRIGNTILDGSIKNSLIQLTQALM